MNNPDAVIAWCKQFQSTPDLVNRENAISIAANLKQESVSIHSRFS